MAAPTVLNIEFLTRFINTHIDAFQSTLGPPQTLISEVMKTEGTTLDASKPLILGNMASGAVAATADTAATKEGAGAGLNGTVNAAAAEIKRILEEQTQLFADIKSALEETILQLTKNKQKNLESINPEAFMNIFEDVESDFGGSGSTTEEA
ncbi:type VII secretion system-associated protein [Streptomyces sp. NPDC102441]|uniref:type VII secretion system-associated protein n=1 Tax=Streptomyces sp. NPDC102441 TaxID=3366176 RepID=UPI00382459BB